MHSAHLSDPLATSNTTGAKIAVQLRDYGCRKWRAAFDPLSSFAPLQFGVTEWPH